MKTSRIKVLTLLAAASLLGGESLRPAGAGAEEMLALLSSRSGYYREAYKGFRENIGQKVPLYILPEESPKWKTGTRIAVAFGASASLQPVPNGVTLIYCMAPGTQPDPGSARGPVIKVQMLPPSMHILGKLKEMQPALKNLLLFWVSEPMEETALEMQSACAALGVKMISKKLKNADELADQLRSLQGRPDAIWIPPDPLLINAQSFAILKGYSWANSVPFYVPNEGLVEKGATACVSSSFYEIGKTAALAARKASLENQTPENYYPESLEVFVNLKAAKICNLDIPAEVLRKAAKVIQ